MLRALAYGTARHVAKISQLTAYPQETTRDLEHVRLLADRFDPYLVGLLGSRSVAQPHGDTDTVDLLTGRAFGELSRGRLCARGSGSGSNRNLSSLQL